MTIAPSITATDTPSSPILMLWIDMQYEILTFFGLVVRHSLKTDDFSSIYLTFLLASRGKNLDFSFLALGTRRNSNKPQNNKKKIVTCFCYVCVHSTTIDGQYKH